MSLICSEQVFFFRFKLITHFDLFFSVTTKLAERELLLIVEYCRFGNARDYILSNRSRFVDQINPSTGELDLNRARIIGYDRNRFEFFIYCLD